MESAPLPIQVHQASQPTPAAASQPAVHPTITASSQLPKGHPPVAGAGQAQQPTAGKSIKGTIKQVIGAGKYVYLELDTSGGVVWAAVPKANVDKGQEVTVQQAALMQNFKSKTLKREFAEVWFGLLAPGSVAATNKVADKQPEAVPTAPAKKVAPPADGITSVADLFARAKELSGQQVTVRGKVVKFNPAIMNVNWIHIQDGSGTAEAKNNDITITSSDTTAVGNQITVTGIVVTDKDFGHGYKYSVIIEKAKLKN